MSYFHRHMNTEKRVSGAAEFRRHTCITKRIIKQNIQDGVSGLSTIVTFKELKLHNLNRKKSV